MRELLAELIVAELGSPTLEDQARLDPALGPGESLAFTTDSFVVSPLFFPGGDIGRLAVHGTVNDLAVGGAIPRWLSCGLVLEEGLPLEDLRRVLRSLRAAADEAGVAVVTGDTKVVQRGAADRLFLNTAGIGVIPAGVRLSAAAVRPGDVLLVSGPVGDHGAAILVARGELALEADVHSDCMALTPLCRALIEAVEVHALRDATRGGLAAVLHEWAAASGVGIVVDEVPARPAVRGLCELLGLDPVHLANEGRLVAAVPEAQAERALTVLRALPGGEGAARVGRVREGHRVTVRGPFGGERLLELPDGELLPRIC